MKKYVGDVVLYKTFTAEIPSEKRIKNEGQHKKLRADGHHETILTHEEFDAVQAAIGARKRKTKNVE